MLDMITQVNGTLNGIVWGWPALILLAFVGVLTTCITKCFQISHFGHWMKHTIGAIFRDSEVTWWDVDKWTEKSYDYIWVATYNPATGGVISKYKEPDDQNMMAWEKTDTEWGGFHRIKSVCWRNCNY